MSADDFESHPMYVRLRGRITGPYDLGQLKALYQRGQFSRAHEVSVDRQKWGPAGRLDGIFRTPNSKLTRGAAEDLFDDSAWETASTTVVESRKDAKPIWHYSIGEESHGPVTLAELKKLATSGRLNVGDLVWKVGMADWMPAGELDEFESSFVIPLGPSAPSSVSKASKNTVSRMQNHYCHSCGLPTDSLAAICPGCGVPQNRSGTGKHRITAALFAFFLGGIGVHHFYLGNTTAGIFYVLFFWTAIPLFIAFFEGISYLCMSDAQFATRYCGR